MVRYRRQSDPPGPRWRTPKVLYNEQTGKFVLWFHLDSSDYFAAHAGVAVADSPTGPFRFVREISPNGYDCRDMTLFREYTDL